VNDAFGTRINLLGKAPRVVAIKQPKSSDVVLHTVTTAEASALKSTESERARVLGTTAGVIKPTCGVIAHREGLVLNAIHHDCVLYTGRAGLSSATDVTNTATSDLSAMPKSDVDTAQ
jgi:hypothetical protein